MQHGAIEIRDGDRDAGGSEVGHEEMSRLGVEAKLAGWPATGARADARFGHQAAVEKLGNTLCNDRP